MDRLITRAAAAAISLVAFTSSASADDRCGNLRSQHIRLDGELAVPLTDMALKNKIASMMVHDRSTACAIVSKPMPGIISVEVQLTDAEKKRMGEISEVSIQTVWALDDYDEATDVKLHPMVVPFRKGKLGMARASNELGMKPFKPGRYMVNVNVFGTITRSNQTIYFTVAPPLAQ
jgi:hypothetical protein